MSADQLQLALRASAPDGLDREADWADVLRRAAAVPAPRRKGARRGRVPGGLALALVVVGGAAALAAPRLLAPTRVAPTVTTVERDLRGHLVGQRLLGIGIAPRVVPGSTRLVTSIPLAGGGTARLYVARTRRGLPCFATTGRPFGRSGCQLASDPRLLWARFGSWKTRASTRYTVVGHAAPGATRSVAILYRDGRRQVVPHVASGWFLAELRRGGSVPVALVARSATGRVLARTAVKVSLGPGRAPILPRCTRLPDGRTRCRTPATARHRPALPVRAAPAGAVVVAPVQSQGSDCVRIGVGEGRWSVTCLRHVGRLGVSAALVRRGPAGLVVGRYGGGIARLVVRYADGDRSSVLRSRRHYQVPLPAWRWRGPHRPVEVLGYDRAGKLVARRSIPPA